MSDAPKRIWLCHQGKEDDYNPGRGRYVGTDKRGLFWVTTPFVWSRNGTPGRDFVALYRWNERGEFLSAAIEELASRADALLPGNNAKEDFYQAGIERAISTLETPKYCDIRVAPFVHVHDGIEFGLVPRPPEEDDDAWAVNAMPGDYMCFWAPWDGGYDT